MSEVLYGYVGGKTRLKPHILEALSRFPKCQYREPFFGGGSVGLHMMKWCDRPIWINDRDAGIHAIWQCVSRYPENLKHLVRRFKPSSDAFDILKSYVLRNPVAKTGKDIIMLGFAKLALQKISWGGLGVMARSSVNSHELERRWSATSICEKIDLFHDYMKRNVKLTNSDYSDLIADETESALLYLDPPYFSKGEVCYNHAFQYPDHLRLSHLLQKTSHKWVLSYDDCDVIRELYQGWAKIVRVCTTYNIRWSRKRDATELLISSRL
jgi:DNA adenine methylase